MKTIGMNRQLWQREKSYKPLWAWLVGQGASEASNMNELGG